MSREVPDWVEGWLELTANTEPRPMYRRWCALSTVAAALRRKCFLEWGSETFYPNMYIVLVGPPAARKGTAMRPAVEMMAAHGLKIAADETSRQKLVKTLQDEREQIVHSDGRINFHSSLTILSTELTVFLGYKNAEFLTILCDWFDCKSRFVYDTFLHGEQEVINLWVNLLGATTPSTLQSSMPEGAVGTGFTSRTVFVYEEDKAGVIIKPTLGPPMLFEAISRDYARIKSMDGPFLTTPGFDDLYTTWRTNAESDPPQFNELRLEFYIERRMLHIMKLSMLYSAARSGAMEITEDDLAKAIWTLETTEQKMAQVFRGVGSNPLAVVQIRLMKVLAERGAVPFHALAEMFFNDVSQRQLGEIIASLEAMGFCKVDPNTKSLLYTRKHS